MIYRVGDNDNSTYDYNKLKTSQSSGSDEKFSLDYQDKTALSSKKKEDTEEEQSLSGEQTKSRKERVTQSKSGVMLELSNTKATAGDGARQGGNTDRAAGSILPAGLREFFHNLISAVKEMFDKIWNDQPTTVQSADVTPEEAERYTQEYLAMKGIDTESASGNPAQASEAVPPTTSEMEQSTGADWQKNATGRMPGNSQAQGTKQPQGTGQSLNFADKDAEIQKYLRSGNLEQVISLLTENGHKTIARNSNLLTYYDKTGKLSQINPSDRERILHGDRNTKKL